MSSKAELFNERHGKCIFPACYSPPKYPCRVMRAVVLLWYRKWKGISLLTAKILGKEMDVRSAGLHKGQEDICPLNAKTLGSLGHTSMSCQRTHRRCGGRKVTPVLAPAFLSRRHQVACRCHVCCIIGNASTRIISWYQRTGLSVLRGYTCSAGLVQPVLQPVGFNAALMHELCFVWP